MSYSEGFALAMHFPCEAFSFLTDDSYFSIPLVLRDGVYMITGRYFRIFALFHHSVALRFAIEAWHVSSLLCLLTMFWAILAAIRPWFPFSHPALPWGGGEPGVT